MKAYNAVLHHREVVGRELEFIVDSKDELLGQIEGLAIASAMLERIAKSSQVKTSEVLPKPSHEIMRGVYEDILSYSSPNDPSQGLAFIGKVLVPMTQAGTVSNPIQGVLCDKYETACSDAERYFDACLSQIRTGRLGPPDTDQNCISVYHSPEGIPLTIRKSFQASSALSLQPVSFIGSRLSEETFTGDATDVPDGCIVAMDYSMNAHHTGFSRRSGFSLHTYLVKGPLAIRPLRLSPWAYEDKLDRSIFAIYGDGTTYDQRRGRIVEERTLEDFNLEALQVMDMCGVG